MRFRIETQKYTDTHTVNGESAPVTRTRRVAVPVLPRDIDVIAVRGVVGLVLALTLVSITWSTVSIAHLLNGTWTAYLAGAVFDLAWLATLGMSFIVRFRPDRRATVDKIGWALLAVTVTAIALEGLQTGGVAMACIGASVSIAAKVLWWTLNRATAPDLSPDDAQWVAQQISRASAQMAVAAVRRQVARVEDQATAQMLAMEASRRPPIGTDVIGRPVGEVATVADSPTPPAGRQAEVLTEVPQVTALSSPTPEDTPDVPGDNGTPRGFKARRVRELVASGVTDVPTIRERLADSGVTVDPSHIRRIIRESRATANEPNPYL